MPLKFPELHWGDFGSDKNYLTFRDFYHSKWWKPCEINFPGMVAFTEISGEHSRSGNVKRIQTRTNDYPCRAPSKITGIFDILLQAVFSLRKCSQHFFLLSDTASDTSQRWEGYILSSRCSLVQLLLFMFGELSRRQFKNWDSLGLPPWKHLRSKLCSACGFY